MCKSNLWPCPAPIGWGRSFSAPLPGLSFCYAPSRAALGTAPQASLLGRNSAGSSSRSGCSAPLSARSGSHPRDFPINRSRPASGHAGAQLQVRLIKGRRFPACPYCHEISFERAHSDGAFRRARSAPGTRYRRHRLSALSQTSNKALLLDPARPPASSDRAVRRRSSARS